MLTLNRLQDSKNSILYEIPPGKPNPDEPCTLGIDKRTRVIQSPLKGKESWYYTFNFIRNRIGKHPCDELRNDRDIEMRCSKRRKAKIIYQDSFPHLPIKWIRIW